jgi:hypothetical protein
LCQKRPFFKHKKVPKECFQNNKGFEAIVCGKRREAMLTENFGFKELRIFGMRKELRHF